MAESIAEAETEVRAAMLKNLIKEQINQSFIEDYKAKATDPEGLGILIAKYFKWDGLAILETMYAALEDANFHSENVKVEEMINKVKAMYNK